jgi:hypothetical protein
VAECLLCKHEALNSKPSSTKKKKGGSRNWGSQDRSESPPVLREDEDHPDTAQTRDPAGRAGRCWWRIPWERGVALMVYL